MRRDNGIAHLMDDIGGIQERHESESWVRTGRCNHMSGYEPTDTRGRIRVSKYQAGWNPSRISLQQRAAFWPGRIA